jgi:hypothetical protein
VRPLDLSESYVIAIALAITLSPTLLLLAYYVWQEKTHAKRRSAKKQAYENESSWILIWRSVDGLGIEECRSDSLDYIAATIANVGKPGSAELFDPREKEWRKALDVPEVAAAWKADRQRRFAAVQDEIAAERAFAAARSAERRETFKTCSCLGCAIIFWLMLNAILLFAVIRFVKFAWTF